MTIAVAISGISYDHAEALSQEQRRIAQFLTFASPRDADDLSQVLKYTWPMTGTTPDTLGGDTAGSPPAVTSATQFPTFIQASWNPLGQPQYNVYLRDDSGVLHSISNGSTRDHRIVVTPANSPGLNAAHRLGATANVGSASGPATTIQPGDIIRPGAAVTNTPIVVGRIKFEAESGLALASINTRLADINNVIETLAKVLSVQSDIFNAASGLVR